MQIFTVEMIKEFLVQIRDFKHEVLGAVFSTAWQEIADFFPSIIVAINAHDWSLVMMKVLILLGCGAVMYRLFRRFTIASMELMLDR